MISNSEMNEFYSVLLVYDVLLLKMNCWNYVCPQIRTYCIWVLHLQFKSLKFMMLLKYWASERAYSYNAHRFERVT